MKDKIIFLAYGILLVVVWCVGFMYVGQSDALTALLGLSFTFVGTYFLQEAYGFRLSARDKWLILLAPLLYDAAVYVSLWDIGYFNPAKRNAYVRLFYIHMLNPINISLLILMLNLTRLKDLKKPVNVFIFAYIILFYSYIFYNQWHITWMGRPPRSFAAFAAAQGDASAAPDTAALDTTIRLSAFSFIDPRLDTVRLQSQAGKFVLLETWSENCGPCLRAMRELPDFYRSVEDKLEVYYVYEHHREEARNRFKHIFSFGAIADKSRICIDIGQRLYDRAGMSGFPYFLLFDPGGKLVDIHSGYMGRAALSGVILKHLNQ